MGYSTLSWQIDDRVLTLTLNRPAQLNAFTTTMADELVDAYTRASADDAVGAVVVTGAGRAFCAGMDLSVGGNVFGLDEALNPSLEQLNTLWDDPAIVQGVRDTGGRVSLAVYECKKPVIGAINGAAVGIGATMTLPMDIRLASDKARIGFVFGKIGVVPEACSTWFLPRIVGLPQALRWCYSGRVFDAAEAARGGLIEEPLAPEALLPQAMEIAREIADHTAPVAVAVTRQMLWRLSAEPAPWGTLGVDAAINVHLGAGPDVREGVAAFLEKRAPQFPGKVSTDMPPQVPWWPQA